MLTVKLILGSLAAVVAAAALVSSAVTWLSPLMLASQRQLLQPWHIPVHLWLDGDRLGVRWYIAPGFEPGQYAFACFLGFRRAIVLSSAFFHHAPDDAVHFALAHELGHHTLGHVGPRLCIRVLGLHRTRAAQHLTNRQEDEANEWAERYTSLPRTVLWSAGNPKTAKERA